MNVEVKKLDKLKRVIKVEIGGQDFIKEKNDNYIQTGKNLKAPGFRPGTAPIEVLEKTHGPRLREEFLKKALPSYYHKALQECNLTPVVSPRIYDVDFDGQHLIFCAEFEIKPELEIKDPEYKGLKVKDKKIEVNKDEIEKVLNNLREGVKKVVAVELENEGIAKWAGYPDYGRLEEAIKAEIYIEKLKARRQDISGQITRYLLKNIKLVVSQSEVDHYHKELVDREIYNLRMRGVTPEDLEKYKKEVEDKLRPAADAEIKLFYIFEAIAKKENIKVENNLGEVIIGFILRHAQYA